MASKEIKYLYKQGWQHPKVSKQSNHQTIRWKTNLQTPLQYYLNEKLFFLSLFYNKLQYQLPYEVRLQN